MGTEMADDSSDQERQHEIEAGFQRLGLGTAKARARLVMLGAVPDPPMMFEIRTGLSNNSRPFPSIVNG